MPTFYGSAGRDSLIGTSSPDIIYGYAKDTFPENEFGDDYLRGGAGNDIIYGGGGNDTILGDEGSDSMYGGDGNDTLYGGEGNDKFYGGAGNDTFVITDNKYDTYDGGTGFDTLKLAANINVQFLTLTTAVGVESINLNGFRLNGTGYADKFDLSGLTSFNYGGKSIDLGDGNDTFTGHAGADYVRGGNGSDRFYGGAGDDVFSGGNNSDYFDGGGGNDTFLIDGNDSDTFLGGAGTDTVRLEGVTTRYRLILDAASGVERLDRAGFALNGTSQADIFDFTGLTSLIDSGPLIDLGYGNDTFRGFAGNDRVSGGGGSDTITTYVGNDTLDGGTGSDTLIGGLGNDVYYVDHAGDRVVEYAGQGVDTVYSTITYTLAAYADNLVLSGAGATTGTGNELNNVMSGNSGDNVLRGLAGNDTLSGLGGDDAIDGGLGSDTMYGGLGNDIFVVDSSGDRVVETVGQGTDTVYSSISYTLGANLENLVLSGTAATNGTGNDMKNVMKGNAANNVLRGGAGNDVISGLAGNDTLEGGLGNDSLVGGAGADALFGGAGSDYFVFRSPSESTVATTGRDTIYDFAVGDKIDLRGIDASTLATGDNAFHFIGTTSFTKTAGELRYVKSGSDLCVFGDLNGDGNADFSILVKAHAALSSSDFLL